MKTIKTILAVVLAAACCTEMAAQGFRREPMPEGSYSPVTNINRNGFPRVLSDGSVMFRVNAPQAQLVQIDLGGTKYDMQKGDGGGEDHRGWMEQGRTAQIMDNLIAQGKAVPISPYASSPSIFSNTNHLPAAKLTPHYGVRIAITVAPSKILSRIFGKGGG